MKASNLLILAILVIAHSSLFSQSDSLIIGLEAFTHSEKIMLRWAPINAHTFNYCKNYGYKLTRFTVSENGVPLNYQEMQATKLILLSNAQPVSDSLWDDVDTTLYSQIAAGAIYGEKFGTIDLDTSSLSQKVKSVREEENRYGFGLYAADQSFDVAKMMALAYEDTTVSNTKEYLYIVEPASNAGNLPVERGTKFVKASILSVLPAVNGLDYFVQGKTVTLFWPVVNSTNNFTGFFIERKVNNSSYLRLNEKAHTSLTNDVNPNNILYQDLLPDTINTYTYRVIGYSPFGFEGPASDPVSVKAKSESIAVKGYINEAKEQMDGSIKLKWDVDHGSIDDISGWIIYRAPDPDSPFVQITPTPLPLQQLEFIDTEPHKYNFYKVIAIDVNGYTHESAMTLGEKTDSIAPQVPTGLEGVGYITGEIKLNWNWNVDEDILGYRVWMSNFPNDEYIEISTDVISDTFFTYIVSLNNLSKNIYFKISALDQRHNESAYSPYILVKRPDIIPPDAANLYDVIPQYGGAKLKFVMSPSNDVALHRIQRRAVLQNFWTTLKEYQGLRQTPNELEYSDTTASFKKEYLYRIEVKDESGLSTYSKQFKIKPLTPPVRGIIFDESYLIVPHTGGIVGTQQYYANLNKFHYKNIILEWDYDLKEDVEEFIIYRKVGNGPMVTIRTISFDYWNRYINMPGVSGTKFFFIDDELLVKRSYLSSLVSGGSLGNGGSGGNGGGAGNGGGGNGGGGNGGGGGSTSSPNYGNDTYIYQIKCKHKDGSMSNPSQEITVSLI